MIGAELQRVGRRLQHRETKTAASDAALPLPSLCLSALGLRAGEQEKAVGAAGPGWQGSKFVFTTRFGMPVEPRTFNRRFAARCTTLWFDRSRCMTPGGRARPCWSTWTCTLG